MSELSSSRRLAGISFVTQPLTVTDTLPRMDIAVFVGFAASGPLHTPVVVEDISQFSSIFGEDLQLATDPVHGQTICAYLAPTVRSFFNNGGCRCWIIRVADEKKAKCNYFQIPGLLVAEKKNGNQREVRPAFAMARSEGSWSDALRVSAVLSAQPVNAEVSMRSNKNVIELELAHSEDLNQGDMLRITFEDLGYVVMIPVNPIRQSIDDVTVSPPKNNVQTISLSTESAKWFSRTCPLSSPPGQIIVQAFTQGKEIDLRLVEEPKEDMLRLLCVQDSDLDTKSFLPGTVLKVRSGSEQAWLTIHNTLAKPGDGSPPCNVLQIDGDALWEVQEVPKRLPTSNNIILEKLSFELSVSKGNEVPVRLVNLGLAPHHIRYWGATPTDEMLFRKEKLSASTQFIQELLNPRFPLAASSMSDTVYYPIGMPTTRDNVYLEPVKMSESALARDGLEEINAAIFLDPKMTASMIETLMATADYLRYQGPVPQLILRGIHAVLNIEEATLIAVPDAVHCGWSDDLTEQTRHISSLQVDEQIVKNDECQTNGIFQDCKTILPPLLKFENTSPDSAETLTLLWETNYVDATFNLQKSDNIEFVGADSEYIRTNKDKQISTEHLVGLYYYRVRIESSAGMSNWSNLVKVSIQPPKLLKRKFEPDNFLDIQRALIRMCAARGDMTAVLSLPEHFREKDAISYVKTLKSTHLQLKMEVEYVSPLSSSEAYAFSYSTVFHPWSVSRIKESKSEFVAIPPDGAICGMIAQRALSRGAWVAPANEVLKSIVALTPSILCESRLPLQEYQINLIRQEPNGFTTLTACCRNDAQQT